MIANAAFGGSRTAVVLHAIAGEDFNRAVVHLHREVDRELTLTMTQNLPHPIIKTEHVRGDRKLLDRDLEQVTPVIDPLLVCDWCDVRVRPIENHVNLR